MFCLNYDLVWECTVSIKSKENFDKQCRPTFHIFYNIVISLIRVVLNLIKRVMKTQKLLFFAKKDP